MRTGLKCLILRYQKEKKNYYKLFKSRFQAQNKTKFQNFKIYENDNENENENKSTKIIFDSLTFHRTIKQAQ